MSKQEAGHTPTVCYLELEWLTFRQALASGLAGSVLACIMLPSTSVRGGEAPGNGQEVAGRIGQ